MKRRDVYVDQFYTVAYNKSLWNEIKELKIAKVPYVTFFVWENGACIPVKLQIREIEFCRCRFVALKLKTVIVHTARHAARGEITRFLNNSRPEETEYATDTEDSPPCCLGQLLW